MENSTQLDDISSTDQEILATKWLTVRQLEEAGIPCHRGPFVKEEIQKIHEAIKRYQTEHKLSDEQLDDLVYSDVPNGGFWSYVALAVPYRGVKSVFYHVRRARNSLGKAGKWGPGEDEQLRRAVHMHGSDWGKVANMVLRSPADCSDRYRQHVQYKDTKRTGAWSPEEESQLLCAIEGLAKAGFTDITARGFWVSVSEGLGGTRTPKQCRSKWSDTFRVKIENERWSKADNYILVCKIASLDLDEETEIDWNSLNDPSWMWSGHFLQQRWKGLKAPINTDGMSHRDIVYALVVRTKPIITANTSTPAQNPTPMSGSNVPASGSSSTTELAEVRAEPQTRKSLLEASPFLLQHVPVHSLEQAQIALQKATPRVTGSKAVERSQRACEQTEQYEKELAGVCTVLKVKRSELEAVLLRLADGECSNQE